MPTDSKPEAQAVAEILEKYHGAQVLTVTAPDGKNAPVLLTPSSSGVVCSSVKKYVDEYRSAPERRSGTATMTDLASFIAHVTRFKDTGTAVFADANREAPALVAVLDYHLPGAESAPRFGKHRVSYACPLSETWKAWRAQADEWMDQATFAAWLEDHLADVGDPEGAGDAAKSFIARFLADFASPGRLLELSRGLSVRVDQSFKSAQNLSTGEATMQFISVNLDGEGAPLKIPTAFLLTLPVFEGGDVYQLPCRLRYKPQSTRVVWSFSVYRDDLTFDKAFGDACDKVAKETGCPLFRGSPEA